MLRTGTFVSVRSISQCQHFRPTAIRLSARYNETVSSHFFESIGHFLLRIGVAAPLVTFGVNKFNHKGVDEIGPIINACPWLSWLHPTFGVKLTAELIGYVELVAGALVLLSLVSPQAGVLGGALATATNAVSCSTMLAIPLFEESYYLNPTGQVIVKDVALLGASLIVMGTGFRGLRR